MNEDEKFFLAIRFLGCFCGLIGGGFVGTLFIILLIIITGYTFGLETIWPGTFAGALVGALAGFLFPRIGKFLVAAFVGKQDWPL
jgi:hypothetical protein